MKNTKNNVGKPAYDEKSLKQSIKLAMSESPAEEFDMDLLQTLQQFDKWSKDNPGKSYDDFLKEMGIDRAKLSSGGLSRKTLLTMLKNEYPKSYSKEIEDSYTDQQIKDLLEYLDGVKSMNTGGLVSNYKKDLRKP
jgi:hypothetical protein|tara:strand:+ start:65 stop:472 length:408 start_codon:yes stop_codon:yes gene_type:complete